MGIELDELGGVIRDAIARHVERISATDAQSIFPLVFNGDIRGTVCHAGHPATAVGFFIKIGGGIPDAWKVPRCPRCDYPVNPNHVQDAIDYGHWNTCGEQWHWCAGPKDNNETDADAKRVANPAGTKPEEAATVRGAGDAGTDG